MATSEALLLAAAIAGQVDPVLVDVLSRARVSVPDARSIEDVQLCEVDRKGRAFVAFGRPREARGYYVLTIRPGKPSRLLDLDLRGDSEGLALLGARAMEKRMEPCRWVSPEELAGAWEALSR